MEHFYQGIPGFFDFEGLYRERVQGAAPGAVFVEVGAWLGRSTAFLAVEAVNAAKGIKVHVVDPWPDDIRDAPLALYGPPFKRFVASLDRPEFEGLLHIHRTYSHRAARGFAERSVDFCFIDGDHSERAVKLDIKSWLPKVKSGGVLAGHDMHEEGVRVAVEDTLGEVEVRLEGLFPYWVYRVPAEVQAAQVAA